MHPLPRTHCFSGQAGAVSVRADGAVCKMKTTCGNTRFSRQSLNHMRLLGHQIDAGNQPFVFDAGFVNQNLDSESEAKNEFESYTRNRSQAGPRQGQRARSRSGPSREAEPFRSRAIEEAHGAEFRLLAQHYKVLGFEDPNGLWIAITANPLGPSGPQANFMVGVPTDKTITPRGWAFCRIGPAASLFPLKHTNFPDASICAFTKASKAWSATDGLLSLIDHFSLWAVKSWHRMALGSWPGPQVGACALYRRNEFTSGEWCGCESGRRYGACHEYLDSKVEKAIARRQFRSLFLCEYEDRQPPKGIIDAARSRWKQLPDMAGIFAHRRSLDEPAIPLL